MEVLIEEIFTYGIVFAICAIIVVVYLRQYHRKSKEVEQKVAQAKEDGIWEPVSLYPHIDLNTCIGSGACITACPEKDILGIVDGVATVVNTTNCVGHGACFHACPVEAITLRIGTESRGVDLPHVSENFETNMKGIYIAGELGGIGLIKNSVEQGCQAMAIIAKNKKPSKPDMLDVLIIGAGPAGISASLEAKKQGLTALTLEQESLGGTVYTFPRSKIVMTAPMDLPLYGKAKLTTTSKDELISLWEKVIEENDLKINENTKVEKIIPQKEGTFKLVTSEGDEYISNQVLLATGRRGSPRKLGVPGEDLPKVYYRLLEPERIQDKDIVVVGGGDSAVESAMMLMEENRVTLSYRKDKFARIKPKNREKINQAIDEGKIEMRYNSNLVSIQEDRVLIKGETGTDELPNDLVYVFAGGELPTKFLENIGISITRRFGHILKKHE
ncbi:MAG: NAD(P)-binding domain-containing protein [Cyclobacteriaceae bacterium]